MTTLYSGLVGSGEPTYLGSAGHGPHETMKITEIELFKVKPRWLFVRISTDEGIAGWGEPVLEGRGDTTECPCTSSLAARPAIGRCNRIGGYAEVDAAVERLASVRSAVGPDIEIAIDFHGRVHGVGVL